jgi:hypothetical protein
LTYGYFYKFVLKDASDNLLGTYDNIYGIVGVQTAVGTTIPTGMINLWYGAIGSVPSGWYLCDGANGTPDLRDRFVVGAGSTYSVAATGGATDAIVVSHTHTATSTSTVTDPGHSHTADQPSAGSTAANGGIYYGQGGNRATGTSVTSITVATATTNASAGVSGTNANLPPYYALCYVMKS